MRCFSALAAWEGRLMPVDDDDGDGCGMGGAAAATAGEERPDAGTYYYNY